jgi:hypothetical protein
MCVRTLAAIAKQKTAPAAARVVAANSLLDRGWGKADVVHAGPDGGPIQVIIRQLVDVVQVSDGKQALVIEHDDSECDK